METRKRLLNQSSEEESSEEWVEVSKRRKPQSTPSPKQPPVPCVRVTKPQALSHPTITPRQHGLPKFKLVEKISHLTAYQSVLHLETENPALKISAKPNLQGELIIQPKDRASTQILRAYPQYLQELNPAEKTTKAILAKYPLALPLDPILKVENITSAERCLSANKQATPSILVSFSGPVPSTVDLGTWGIFSIRPFHPEPLRCHNCQRFGHHVRQCSNPTICAICSGRHQTQQCLDLLKAGKQIQARCPNCRKGHHAWNRECPQRRALIHQMPGARSPQPPKAPPARTTPAPAQPKPQRVKRERQWRSTPKAAPQGTQSAPAEGFWAPPAPAPTTKPKTSVEVSPQKEMITLPISDLTALLSSFALKVADLLGANLDREKVSTVARETINHIQTTSHTPQRKTSTQHIHKNSPAPKHSTPIPPTPQQQTNTTATPHNIKTPPQTTPRTRAIPKDLQHLVQEEEVTSVPEMDQINFPALPLFNPRDPRLTKTLGVLPTPVEME